MEANPIELKWDREADVIVAGFGGAGACAAIAAHDAGARVLMIEKAPFGGGNTACALSPMHLPNIIAEGVKYYRALSFRTMTGRIGFVFRALYQGGSNLLEALAFGRIAGE